MATNWAVSPDKVEVTIAVAFDLGVGFHAKGNSLSYKIVEAVWC